MNTRLKKIIKVVAMILIVVTIVLVGAWLLSRRSATNNNRSAPSFRDFLGFGVQTPGIATNPDGSLVSQFNPDGTPISGNGTGSTGDNSSNDNSSNIGTNTSTFSNGSPITPVGSGGPLTGGEFTDPTTGGGTGSTTTTTGNSSSSNSTTTGAVGTVTPGAVCSDADVNITFTPDELAKLQALQNRFYAVAQTLHTDADAATALANYSNFKLKQDQLDSLLNYCVAVAPRIGGAPYQNRVPTPFWYNPADLPSRTNGNPVQIDPATGDPILPLPANTPLGYLGVPGQIGGSIDVVYRSPGPENGLRSIEQVLRLNLW